jgi:hypothetical protein
LFGSGEGFLAKNRVIGFVVDVLKLMRKIGPARNTRVMMMIMRVTVASAMMLVRMALTFLFRRGGFDVDPGMGMRSMSPCMRMHLSERRNRSQEQQP